MRHVTPYAFVEHAIKVTIQSSENNGEYKLYIRDICEITKTFIQSKEGICLTLF